MTSKFNKNKKIFLKKKGLNNILLASQIMRKNNKIRKNMRHYIKS
jgi:hypothetical protein